MPLNATARNPQRLETAARDRLDKGGNYPSEVGDRTRGTQAAPFMSGADFRGREESAREAHGPGTKRKRRQQAEQTRAEREPAQRKRQRTSVRDGEAGDTERRTDPRCSCAGWPAKGSGRSAASHKCEPRGRGLKFAPGPQPRHSAVRRAQSSPARQPRIVVAAFADLQLLRLRRLWYMKRMGAPRNNSSVQRSVISVQ